VALAEEGAYEASEHFWLAVDYRLRKWLGLT